MWSPPDPLYVCDPIRADYVYINASLIHGEKDASIGKVCLYRSPLAFLTMSDRVSVYGEECNMLHWLPPALTLAQAAAELVRETTCEACGYIGHDIHLIGGHHLCLKHTHIAL